MPHFMLPVILFSISSSITPGPNNIMLMSSGLNYGVKQSIPHYLGICLGFPLMILLTGLGLSSMLIHYPVVHEVIKYVGAAYMLYLAWQIATSYKTINDEQNNQPLSFLQAAAFQWANPKAWIMGIGSIAAYTSITGDLSQQVLLIALIFLVTVFPCSGAWLVFGASLKKILKNKQHQQYFNWAMGGLLALSILLIFIE